MILSFTVLFIIDIITQRSHDMIMGADGSNPLPLAAGSAAQLSPYGRYSREVDGIWTMDVNRCNKTPFILQGDE